MSRRFSEEEIESLKKSGFASSTSSRCRVLSVFDLLCRFTNESEGFSAAEIARVIGECSGKEPSENTILEDLHQLQGARPMGIEVGVPRHGENIGFRAMEKPLSSEEAILVSDVIRTSKFISEDQRETLCGRILRFASDSRIDDSIEAVFVDEKVNDESFNIFHSLRIATQAIKNNQRVSFRKKSHWMNGAMVESDPIEEDPVAIVFSFGRYYLETCGHRENGDYYPRFHRIDDVCGMMDIGKVIRNQEEVELLRKRVVQDTRERVDMLGDGVTRTLFLKVDGNHAKYVYERFGHDLKFRHIDEEKAVGFVCVRLQLSPTLFRWLFGMGGSIELVKPKGEGWIRHFPETAGLSLSSLNMDYNFAISAYRKMLDDAMSRISMTL